MYSFDIEELVKDLSLSESNLNTAQKEINDLSEELKDLKEKISFMNEDNKCLETVVNLNKDDIKKYNEQIKELESKIKTNDEIILKLKKENEELNKNKKQNEIENNINVINNIKDLSKSLGYNFLNEDFEQQNNIENRDENNNIDKIDINEIQKNKINYELKFIELKEKCNKFYNDMEHHMLIRNNYKEYLNEIYQEINRLNESLNISIIGNQEINYNNNRDRDEVYKHIDKIVDYLYELDEIIFNLKEIFGENIENLLNNIQINLINIDNKEYNENNLEIVLQNIKHQIEEIENICFCFEENNNKFCDKNKIIENEVNILNAKLDIINEQNINRENEELNNNMNDRNNNGNNNDGDFQLNHSFLFGIKDKKYRSVILFENRDEDSIENFIDEPKLLRKRWHEICYVYDDYDIYDIYYDIKAVGLSRNSYFPYCSHGFKYDTKVEILTFAINGIESNYKYQNHSITFKINLSNLKTSSIYLRYKEYKNLDILTLGEREERKIYRNEYYGLSKSLAGQVAKFALILKGSFDIVNFKDYFLIKNTSNVNENEYYWGGVVPFGGKRTLIMFSKKIANISFKSIYNFHSNRNIRDSRLYIPIEYVGGNNEIINIRASSPQTNSIFLDEERRQYVVRYRNIRDNKGQFIIEGKLQNKCKGEWLVDVTDEEIDKIIPDEDKLCKPQLQQIAKKIIEDFDKHNKNKDFKFLDYMKIALWVKNNIKYDLNYSGKTEYSALDTYNMKVGVCHHFTKLSNALLYSLGYKVIYISGYVIKNNRKFDENSGHAWSLIKINNKWYPFDSTWGIVSGKLPVGHVFNFFFSKGYHIRGNDYVRFDKTKVNGTFIN